MHSPLTLIGSESMSIPATGLGSGGGAMLGEIVTVVPGSGVDSGFSVGEVSTGEGAGRGLGVSSPEQADPTRQTVTAATEMKRSGEAISLP